MKRREGTNLLSRLGVGALLALLLTAGTWAEPQTPAERPATPATVVQSENRPAPEPPTAHAPERQKAEPGLAARSYPAWVVAAGKAEAVRPQVSLERR